MAQSMNGLEIITDGYATLEDGNLFCYNIECSEIVCNGDISCNNITSSSITSEFECSIASSLAIGDSLAVGNDIINSGNIYNSGIIQATRIILNQFEIQKQQLLYINTLRSDIQVQLDTFKELIFPRPASDYVAFIDLSGSTWIPNTTKDTTGTYTLFSDNVSQVVDETRGYVIKTSTGNFGVRLESPMQTLFCPSYTYSIWVKLTSPLSTVSNNGIVGDFLHSAGSFFLYWNTAGVLRATHGTSYNTDFLAGPTFSTLNVWNHISISYDNTTKLMTMYINGVNTASMTKSTTWTGLGAETGGKMSFGYSYISTTYRGFIGRMDNMRLYNRELTQAEITTLYNYELAFPK
jgi:hypothetical protein